MAGYSLFSCWGEWKTMARDEPETTCNSMGGCGYLDGQRHHARDRESKSTPFTVRDNGLLLPIPNTEQKF